MLRPGEVERATRAQVHGGCQECCVVSPLFSDAHTYERLSVDLLSPLNDVRRLCLGGGVTDAFCEGCTS